MNRLMKNKIIIILMLLLATVNGPAQDNTATDEQPVPPRQETSTPKTSPEQVQPNEEFVPSETISEDLSVPFPVDI